MTNNNDFFSHNIKYLYMFVLVRGGEDMREYWRNKKTERREFYFFI